MRIATTLTTLLTLASLLGAQEQTPYSEGDVDNFLDGARSKGRPAVVLFNFNFDSG